LFLLGFEFGDLLRDRWVELIEALAERALIVGRVDGFGVLTLA
jgi:hypothetical protein